MTVDLSKLEKIAEGNDSHVFRDGSTVYKRFLRLTHRDLIPYIDLVNRSLPILEDIEYSPNILIDGEQYNVHFCGIPILDITEDIDGRPVALAPFVAEPNLDKLTQNPDHYVLLRGEEDK